MVNKRGDDVCLKERGLVVKLSKKERGFMSPREWWPTYPVNYMPPLMWGYFQERARVMYKELKSASVESGGLRRIDGYSGWVRNPNYTTNPDWYKNLYRSYEYPRSQRKGGVRKFRYKKKSVRRGPMQSIIRKSLVLESLKRIIEGKDGKTTKYKNGKAALYANDERLRSAILSFILEGEPMADNSRNVWHYRDSAYDEARKYFENDFKVRNIS